MNYGLYFFMTVCVIISILFFMTLQQKKILTSRYELLRKQYGALSCKCNGIGPTGGFCLDKEKFHVGGNHLWCQPLANELRRLFNGQSVYDFGAGLGWYGEVLLDEKSDGYHITDYKAFDGAENIESVFPDGFVQYLDLSQPVHMSPKDWVLSLEVGEHIPAQHEQTFIQNLHRHNKKGIVLSWAVEGQNGHFHVNDRNNDYIKSIFQKLGYTNDLNWERHLRNVSTFSWFKNTLMVFRR